MLARLTFEVDILTAFDSCCKVTGRFSDTPYIAERQPLPNRRQPVPPVGKVKNTPAFRRSFAEKSTM